LPELLRTRLDLEAQRLTLIEQQMQLLDQKRRELTAQESFDMGLVRQLLQLRCLGWETAWCLVTECFGYRRFQNRRQVGACAGLTPTPYDSGESRREQGIGKDGNRRLRAILIEMSWMWLRLQPDSALTKWFHARFGGNGRSRRIGIVAMARKLLVALWRYLDQSIVPAGAVLKPA
jgi:transposase